MIKSYPFSKSPLQYLTKYHVSLRDGKSEHMHKERIRKYKVLTDSEYKIFDSYYDARCYKDINKHEVDIPTLTIFYEVQGNEYIEYKEWQVDGKFHRRGKPAKEWFYCNDGVVKRESWYNWDKKHREDGPAVIERDENGKVILVEWWFQDEQYFSKDQIDSIIMDKKIKMI